MPLDRLSQITSSGITSTINITANSINASSYSGITSSLTATVGVGLGTTGTVNLDMSLLSGTYQTINMSGDITFTTSNRGTGKGTTIRLVPNAAGIATRNITFPAGWKFVGVASTTVLPNKVGVLTILYFGSAETDCLATIITEI